jgi:plastocyanin
MDRQSRPIGRVGLGLLVMLFMLLSTVVVGAAPRAAVTRTVSIMNTAFAPKTITVNVGDTVIWKNVGQQMHTVTADDHSFDSGNLALGKTFTHTFTKAGTFKFHDQDHPGMTGTVVVQGPRRLPRTGEDAPDSSNAVLLVAALALAAGLVVRTALARVGS